MTGGRIQYSCYEEQGCIKSLAKARTLIMWPLLCWFLLNRGIAMIIFVLCSHSLSFSISFSFSFFINFKVFFFYYDEYENVKNTATINSGQIWKRLQLTTRSKVRIKPKVKYIYITRLYSFTLISILKN